MDVESTTSRHAAVNWPVVFTSLAVLAMAAWLAILNTPVAKHRLPPSVMELGVAMLLVVVGLGALAWRGGTRSKYPLIVVLAGAVVTGAVYMAKTFPDDVESWFHGFGFAVYWYIGMGTAAVVGVFIFRASEGLEDKAMETLLNGLTAVATFSAGFALTVALLM